MKTEFFVKCGNLDSTRTHLLVIRDHKTICGLKYKKEVWLGEASYIDYGKKCKKCFKKKGMSKGLEVLGMGRTY